jgi:copper chaperone NosL
MKYLNGTILFFIGVICLTGIYLFPLWKISLGVPQYPKEIAINIWINRIENNTEKALEIMNVLNHNIGMKKIDPADIPEFSYFPWVLAGLIVTGILVSFYRFNSLRLIWLTILFISLIYAIYDFYLWQYDYGHHLAEDAPIKMEGGAFQPPLIGTKEIANFIVSSYPQTGIIFPIGCILFSAGSLLINNK